MYNRYIQSDRGSYIPIPDNPPQQLHRTNSHTHDPDSGQCQEPENPSKRAGVSLEGMKELWNTLAGRLHLDAGDLLLLAMLYFLYRENADDELLIALGLLLLL